MPEVLSITKPVADNSPKQVTEQSLHDQEASKKELHHSLMIQTKLSVGVTDDPYEKEADSMADKVMRMPMQNFVQRKCADCEKEEKLQRKPLAATGGIAGRPFSTDNNTFPGRQNSG